MRGHVESDKARPLLLPMLRPLPALFNGLSLVLEKSLINSLPRSDAGRVLELQLSDLTAVEIFAAYSQLFGQAPTASEDGARELLLERMCES